MLISLLMLNRLKLMCRKQSDQTVVYKPLGVLKRSMEERPTYGETNTHTSPQQVSCTITPPFLCVHVYRSDLQIGNMNKLNVLL